MGIQLNQKELTETFVMAQIEKTHVVSIVYTKVFQRKG